MPRVLAAVPVLTAAVVLVAGYRRPRAAVGFGMTTLTVLGIGVDAPTLVPLPEGYRGYTSCSRAGW